MVRVFLICFSFLLWLPTVAQNQYEDIVVVEFTIDQKDRVEVTDVLAKKGFLSTLPKVKTTFKNPAKIQILDQGKNRIFSGKVAPTFYINTIPPTPVKKSAHSLSYQKRENQNELLIIYKGKTFRYEINLCNNNNRCNKDESFYSCPSDCPAWAEDGICVSPHGDGHCDPDCFLSADSDCKPAEAGWSIWFKLFLTYVISRLICTVLTLIHVWKKSLSRVRWTMVVLLLGYTGMIVYWLFGRGGKKKRPRMPPPSSPKPQISVKAPPYIPPPPPPPLV